MSHIASIANNPASITINAQRRDVHRLPNGRYWLHGEVLIHLTLHEQVVVDIRYSDWRIAQSVQNETDFIES